MATPTVNLDINEHETFEMSLEFWENDDRTLPIDITAWSFNGAFNFGSLCIPFTYTIGNTNSVVFRVEANQLVNLPNQGTYSIEAISGNDTYRIQQGSVTVDKEVVCS